MPLEITMPQLSDTMSEGTVVKWLKKEGDKVKAGETIAEVETDKATMEMESFDSGTLALIDAREGAKVKVGGRIAVLAVGGEDIGQVKKDAGGKSSAKAEAPAPAVPKAEAPAPANKPAQPPSVQAPSAPQGPASEDGGRLRVSPLARKMAEDRGLDLSRIQGSGPGGRIIQRDIEAAGSGVPAAQSSAAPKAPAAKTEAPKLVERIASGQKQVVPLTKMRSTIALRLQQAKQQLPHFYETIEIDVENVLKLRAALNKQLEAEEIRLSLGDFVAKAVATALLRHPQVNSHLTNNEMTRFGDVNLGMAVALPEGLIVPVLRNINQMGLKEIRVRSADLVDRARAQKLKGDELSGATFTVSNLGTYGVKEFSAIINPPEVGILAIAAAEKRPVVRDNNIVVRTMMNVTLSADHRAVDGATAADFLRTLRQMLEEPGLMLV